MTVVKSVSGLSCFKVWIRPYSLCFGEGFSLAGKFLVMLLLMGPVGYADDGGLISEEIPKQKMVMSRYRPRNRVEETNKRVDSEVVIQEKAKEGLSADLLGDRERLDSWLAQVASSQKAEARGGSIAVDSELMPYEIIPEQGQKVEALRKDRQIKRQRVQDVKKPQMAENYTFNQVAQWVNEVGMNMFTYSGEHFNRDKNNASRYFSPEAWQVVDQFLFQRSDSPFLHLKKDKENSRGMTLDWPVSLSTDMTRRGKIWWVKVPISALIKGKSHMKRAFFEVKIGVLPVERAEGTRFIAQEVMIKQVTVQQKKRGRRE